LPQTHQTYNQFWQTLVPDPNERDTILNVLLEQAMLKYEGTNIEITPEGYAFLQYVGLIPSPPPQQ
jgi:hypothetical protein